MAEQRNEYDFRVRVNNRPADIEESIRETSICYGNEASFLTNTHPNISTHKLQRASFSDINPSKF